MRWARLSNPSISFRQENGNDRDNYKNVEQGVKDSKIECEQGVKDSKSSLHQKELIYCGGWKVPFLARCPYF